MGGTPLPSGWQAHIAENGHAYYHSKVTNLTQWEAPTQDAAVSAGWCLTQAPTGLYVYQNPYNPHDFVWWPEMPTHAASPAAAAPAALPARNSPRIGTHQADASGVDSCSSGCDPALEDGTPLSDRTATPKAAATRNATVLVALRRDSKKTKLGLKVGMLRSGDKNVVGIVAGTYCDGLLFEKDIISHVDGVGVRELSHADFVALLGKTLNADLTVMRAVAEQEQEKLTDSAAQEEVAVAASGAAEEA